jgi:hypothetical protein
MNAAEIRQLLREAIAQFPERDEMLADLGLQTRRSALPLWLAGFGLLGLGLGLGTYREPVLRRIGWMRPERSALLPSVGTALIGAGAGAALFALMSPERRTNAETRTYGTRENSINQVP